MKTTLKISAAVIACWGALETAPLYGSDWKLVDLGALGGSETFAYGINDLGQVVGMSRLAGDDDTHAFFYANGTMVDLAPLNSGDIRTSEVGLNNNGQIVSGVIDEGIYFPAIFDGHSGHTTILGSLGGVTSYGFSGVATAINDAGMAVGYSYRDPLDRHAFAYHNGTLIDLGSFGGYSAAMAVNSDGIVAGFASDEFNGSSRACVWANNSIVDISFGRESEAYAINDHAQVVGFTLAGTQDHAFLFGQGAIRDLGILKRGRNSYAYGINNHGEVVGTADAFFNLSFFTNPVTRQVIVTTNYHDHAFVYSDGKMVDLNSLIPRNSGWELNAALGINDFRQIIVWGSADGGKHFRSFVLAEARVSSHHPTPPGKNHPKDRVPPLPPRTDHRQVRSGRQEHPDHGPRLVSLFRRGWSLPVAP